MKRTNSKILLALGDTKDEDEDTPEKETPIGETKGLIKVSSRINIAALEES